MLARRFGPFLLGTGLALIHVLTGPPVAAQPKGAGVVTSNTTAYKVTITTKFVVPAKNDTIDQIRCYHALPTPRPWARGTETVGAETLAFVPAGPKEEIHKETSAAHALWVVDGKQKPGSVHTFRTTFTVTSVDRTFDPSKSKATWKDVLSEPDDKTAIVKPELLKSMNAELGAVADKLKAAHPPAEALRQMCKWTAENIKYDASIPHPDVDAIMKKKCGHCGHRYLVLEQLAARVGIPMRMVFGMDLSTPDGRSHPLQKIRADFTNVHTWAEAYLPGAGWIELDPGAGEKAFSLPARQVQNNRWFQNYAIWIRQDGKDMIPPWVAVPGGKFRSDYGVENIITFEAARPKK